MAEIQERVSLIEQRLDNNEKIIDAVQADIREIKDKLLLRPSWAVLSIITILTTACGVLLTLAIR